MKIWAGNLKMVRNGRLIVLLNMVILASIVNADDVIESKNRSDSSLAKKPPQQRGISFYIPDDVNARQVSSKGTKKPAPKYSCAGKEDEGHYENQDCKKYWQCLYVGTIFETAVERKCPVGTMFHPIERVCEISTMLTCEGWRKSIYGSDYKSDQDRNQPPPPMIEAVMSPKKPIETSDSLSLASGEKQDFNYYSSVEKTDSHENNFFVESSEALNTFNFNNKPNDHKYHHKQGTSKKPKPVTNSIDYYELNESQEYSTFKSVPIIKPTPEPVEQEPEPETTKSAPVVPSTIELTRPQETSTTQSMPDYINEDYSDDFEGGESETTDDDYEETEYYDDQTEITAESTLISRLVTTPITSTSTTSTSTTPTTSTTDSPSTTAKITAHINRYTTLFSSNLLEKLRNFDRKNDSETTTSSTVAKKVEAKNLTILSSSGKKTLLIPFDKNSNLGFNQTSLNYLIQKNVDNSDNPRQTVTAKSTLVSTTTADEGEFYDDEEEIDEEAFESEDRSILDSDLLLNLQLNTEMDVEASGDETKDNNQIFLKNKNSNEVFDSNENPDPVDSMYRKDSSRFDYSSSSSKLTVSSYTILVSIFSCHCFFANLVF